MRNASCSSWPFYDQAMARRMADARFRKRQQDGIYAPHAAPVNEFVDELRKINGWVPYVAPYMGGAESKLLALFRDPGPKTRDGVGSGMVGPENDDVSAERMSMFLSEAGISVDEIICWNAYPWYINAKPKAPQIDEGVLALEGLIKRCPKIEVVMPHGLDAQLAWKKLRARNPRLARKILTVETYHTSRQALQTNVPGERERREQHIRDAYKEASIALRQ